MHRLVKKFLPTTWWEWWIIVVCLMLLALLGGCSTLTEDERDDRRIKKQQHANWVDSCIARDRQTLCNHRFGQHRCVDRETFRREVERLLK